MWVASGSKLPLTRRQLFFDRLRSLRDSSSTFLLFFTASFFIATRLSSRVAALRARFLLRGAASSRRASSRASAVGLLRLSRNRPLLFPCSSALRFSSSASLTALLLFRFRCLRFTFLFGSTLADVPAFLLLLGLQLLLPLSFALLFFLHALRAVPQRPDLVFFVRAATLRAPVATSPPRPAMKNC
jgi:hypothetical protein